MLTAVPVMKASAPWAPPPFRTPTLRGSAMGQNVVVSPTTPPGAVIYQVEPPKPDFIDSALVSFAIDVVGATGYGILSKAFRDSERYTWAIIFGGLAFLIGGKAILYDLPNIRAR